ncbi:Thoeris anti-defense Tad2 family protein [Streptomyces griseus]
METNNEGEDGGLFGIGGAVDRMREGKQVARLGWTLDGKCWEVQAPRLTNAPFGVRRLSETIAMRYSDGTWGPPEFSVRSLLAEDWFVGVSGDRPRVAPALRPPTKEEFVHRWPTGVSKTEMIEGRIVFFWSAKPFDERDVAAARRAYQDRVVQLSPEGNVEVF